MLRFCNKLCKWFNLEVSFGEIGGLLSGLKIFCKLRFSLLNLYVSLFLIDGAFQTQSCRQIRCVFSD